MNDIQIFNNSEFGAIRTVQINGDVLFCGADIAKALGYSDTTKAIKAHCKADGWTIRPVIDSMGRQQEAKSISEGNVYRLIAHSKLPTAEKFERWVFDEVMPTIRKHGAYMTEQTLEKALTSPDFLIQLATQLKEEKEKSRQLESTVSKQNELLERAKPKICFANCVQTAETSILVGELAKILRQNSIEIGQKRLFEWLRNNGYLIKSGSDKNMPTQYSMERGLFEIKETVISHSDGHTSISKTPKVTGRGQIYFINKFMDREKRE